MLDNMLKGNGRDDPPPLRLLDVCLACRDPGGALAGGGMKKEIISTWECTVHDHLGDFETCPHCDFKQDFSKWEKGASKLVINEIGGKHGSVVIVMVCPKCFEHLWVHVRIPFSKYDIAEYPEDWIEATIKEDSKRRLRALRQWKEGLCGNCKYLEGANIGTSAYRYCKIGSGPVEEECEKYEKLAL